VARDPHEPERTATPLELLFDLVPVIAIAAAAAGLHHAIAEHHAIQGAVTYLMAFFAIWWAWMNYTWFASAYDNDDTLYRLLTMLIMAGSLTMAAGIGAMFRSLDLTLVVTGYVVMRIGMVALWLRAARHDIERRTTAVRYAIGIALVQVYWVTCFLLFPLPPLFAFAMFGLGMVLELAVPVIAERMNVTPWHRHHIVERYGLLTIIVLGEMLLSGSISLQQAATGAEIADFVMAALAALVIVFSMWWLYFSREEHLDSTDLYRAFVWGYGHFVIFASGAAVGAGFAVVVDVIAHHSAIPPITGNLAVGIPLAIYMTGLWFVCDRFHLEGLTHFILPLFACLVLLASFTPIALQAIAVLAVASVVVRNHFAGRSN
jgi:low temperature requirement protein LtrA